MRVCPGSDRGSLMLDPSNLNVDVGSDFDQGEGWSHPSVLRDYSTSISKQVSSDQEQSEQNVLPRTHPSSARPRRRSRLSLSSRVNVCDNRWLS